MLERGFELILTADHGNVEGVGIGKPNVGATADERGERVHVSRTRCCGRSGEKYPGLLGMAMMGLPDDYLALIAPALRAFIGEGKRTVAHGGICIEEVIVPFITIANVE